MLSNKPDQSEIDAIRASPNAPDEAGAQNRNAGRARHSVNSVPKVVAEIPAIRKKKLAPTESWKKIPKMDSDKCLADLINLWLVQDNSDCEVAKRVWSWVRARARSQVHDDTTAEEVTQEVLISIWKNWNRYNPVLATAEAYISGFVRNAVRNSNRIFKTNHKHEAGSLDDQDFREHIESSVSPETGKSEAREIACRILRHPSLEKKDRKHAYFRGFKELESVTVAEKLGYRITVKPDGSRESEAERTAWFRLRVKLRRVHGDLLHINYDPSSSF